MAGMHFNYKKGEMEIGTQRDTFSGFMGMTVYGGALIALLLLFPILLVGGPNIGWMLSLAVTLVIGIIMGVVLKFKGSWYATIILLSIITAIICLLVSVLS